MTVTSAQYNSNGLIDATIDGEVVVNIPDDVANRHREMIAVWEAAGNTIAAYEAPDPSPADLEAERLAQLAASDRDTVRVIDDLIEALIDKGTIGMSDLPEAAQAKIVARAALRAEGA